MESDSNARPSLQGEGSRGEEIARLFGEYVDRFTAGEKLDEAAILKAHPAVGPELLRELRTFLGLGDGQPSSAATGSFGDYRIIRPIGRGGMGIVYEAWQNSLDRRVALKVLKGSALASPSSVSRFINEAHIAARLQHANIVSIYSMGIENGVPYIAMEFVEGETLAQRAVADPIFFAVAFAGVAEGLQHAHERKIIHRDLKPSNLILDKAGRLRILDFGLARREGQETLTRSGEILGTPLYMSPEQARASRQGIDHRTDIYSLGATLYEALASRPPFRGKDHQETISQILARQPPSPRRFNPDLPRDLETIVLRCLEKDPHNRYGTAEALAQDLKRFARGDPIEARPLGALEKLSRCARARKGALAMAAGLILLLLFAGLAFYRQAEEARREQENRYTQKTLKAVLLLEYGAARSPRNAPPERASKPNLILGESGNQAFAMDLDAAGEPGLDAAGDALHLLEEAERLLPDRPEARYHRARGLFRRGRTEEALRCIAPALAPRRLFVPAQIWLEVHCKDHPLAAGILTAAAPPAPPAAPPAARGGGWEAAYRQAAEAEARRDWAKAREAYSALLDRFAVHGEPYLGAALEARLGRGAACLRLDDFDGALEDFGAAQALEPRALEPGLLLGKVYGLKGEWGKAEAKFQSLFATALEKDEAARRIARLYLELAEYERALPWAEAIPSEPLREEERAVCLQRLGRKEEALQAANRAVELNPRSAGAHRALGHVQLGLDRHPEAEAEFRVALQLEPQDLEARDGLATALLRQRRFKEALQTVLDGVALEPWNSRLLFMKGFIQMNFNQEEAALASFHEVLELEPRDCFAMINLGALHSRWGETEESMELHRKAIAINSKIPVAHSNLGWQLSNAGRYEEALAECQVALDLDAEFVNAYKVLAFIYFDQGRTEEATAALEKYLSIASKNIRHCLRLATELEQNGRLEESVPVYRRAMELDPKDIRIPYNLGNVYARLERFDEAIASYQNALAIDPEHGWTHNNLAEAYEKSGQLEKASDHYTLAMKYDPESPDAHWGMGIIHEKQGKPEEAIRAVERGNALDPENPGGLDLLAGLKEKTGDFPSARSARFRELALQEKKFAVRPKSREDREGLSLALDRLARFLVRTGEMEEARRHASRRIEILAKGTERPLARAIDWNGYAWALLTCEPADLRDPRRALEAAERANELKRGKDPAILDTLALALFENGAADRAIAAAEAALGLLKPVTPAGPADPLREALESRLQRFRENPK